MAKAVNTFLEFLGFVVSGTQRNNGAHSDFNIRLPVLVSEKYVTLRHEPSVAIKANAAPGSLPDAALKEAVKVL
jgi:hypothetical protein